MDNKDRSLTVFFERYFLPLSCTQQSWRKIPQTLIWRVSFISLKATDRNAQIPNSRIRSTLETYDIAGNHGEDSVDAQKIINEGTTNRTPLGIFIDQCRRVQNMEEEQPIPLRHDSQVNQSAANKYAHGI